MTVPATVTYNAVERTAQYLADRAEPPHPTVHTVQLTYPMSHADVVKAFRASIKEIKAAHPDVQFDIRPEDTSPEGKSNRFVAIIDAIASNPGVYMPWKEMVKVCEEEGVWSVIDAAHAIGQEVRCFMLSDVHLLTTWGLSSTSTLRHRSPTFGSPIVTSGCMSSVVAPPSTYPRSE